MRESKPMIYFRADFEISGQENKDLSRSRKQIEPLSTSAGSERSSPGIPAQEAGFAAVLFPQLFDIDSVRLSVAPVADGLRQQVVNTTFRVAGKQLTGVIAVDIPDMIARIVATSKDAVVGGIEVGHQLAAGLCILDLVFDLLQQLAQLPGQPGRFALADEASAAFQSGEAGFEFFFDRHSGVHSVRYSSGKVSVISLPDL
ncbi:MAG: hypothetical protein SV239_12825 [Thermodesulfobacteriota bacterium]|jgi:hypothetical protein|uniref:hypothetical protein n=1 Tax=Geoalkalibacter sp. TaxID=3041440 RepID=UPI002AA09569|nr:hypothetical protein [Thermodesulfobacteriota bacterium]